MNSIVSRPVPVWLCTLCRFYGSILRYLDGLYTERESARKDEEGSKGRGRLKKYLASTDENEATKRMKTTERANLAKVGIKSGRPGGEVPSSPLWLA